MKSLLTVLAIVLTTASGFYLNACNNHEEAAVREALNHYLAGHATGDGGHHAQVFHPESKLFWVRDGQLSQRTSAAYIEGASGGPAENESERNRWISSVDITGNVAVAKIVLDYPGAYHRLYVACQS